MALHDGPVRDELELLVGEVVALEDVDGLHLFLLPRRQVRVCRSLLNMTGSTPDRPATVPAEMSSRDVLADEESGRVVVRVEGGETQPGQNSSDTGP